MRQRHIGDIGRFEAELGELAFERLLDGPYSGPALLAIGHRDDVISYARVEQDIAARVLDQIAGHREVARPAGARRKARCVIQRDIAAIEHVHPLDAWFRLLRKRRLRQAHEHQCHARRDRGVEQR